MASSLPAGDLQDTTAFTTLDVLAAAGTITQSECDLYKSKYEQLYHMVVQTHESEKTCLEKAQQLRTDLREHKIELEKAGIRKISKSKSVGEWEKQREQAIKNLREAEEQEGALHFEVNELRRRETELDDDAKALNKRNQETVGPVLQELEAEIKDITTEFDRLETIEEGLREDRAKFTKHVKDTQAETDTLEHTLAALKAELVKIQDDPKRIGKQAENVTRAVAEADEDHAKLTARIAQLEHTLKEQAAQKRDKEATHRAMKSKMTRITKDSDQRMRDIDAVKKSLAFEREQGKVLKEKRAEMSVEGKLLQQRRRDLLALQSRTQKLYDRSRHDLKRKITEWDTLKGGLPLLRNQIVDAGHELAHHLAESKQRSAAASTVKGEVDAFIAQYLRQEGVEKKRREEVEEMLEEISALEKEREMWQQEERLANKQIGLLTSQRQLKARELAKAQSNERSTKEEVKIKELQLLDLTKRTAEVQAKLKQFSAMYDVVKNERNSYVNAIQTANQGLAEMRERIKILLNEVDILQNESYAKDRALGKERLNHQTAQVQRDALRLETNKCHATYRERQQTVEKQIVEIDKLNSVIDGLEREMLQLKQRYEQAVEARNYTGIQLIDRNDELCILYEKSNIHEDTLKKGEVAMREKDEAIRMLRIEVQELQRQIDVTRKLAPEMPELAEKILQLQRQLAEEREVTEKLCVDLETPENAERWRPLEGDDPDEEQLAAKIKVLEDRLSQKKEASLEKDLVLEEVTALADRLQSQAADGRDDTLDTSKRVNGYQARIKEITRKMKAIVSELSMYHATAIKLQQEHDAREEEVSQAKAKLELGEAPTPELEAEYWRKEKQRQMRAEDRALAATHGDAAGIPDQATRTTAEPRPNAYIPDEIGIPKPYGALAPFKPSVPGSTMRHIRRPKPQEIEI